MALLMKCIVGNLSKKDNESCISINSNKMEYFNINGEYCTHVLSIKKEKWAVVELIALLKYLSIR